MSFTGRSRTKCFGRRQDLCLMVVLSVMLTLAFGRAGLAVEGETVQHYKILSVVEYEGKGQFRSPVEALFIVRKQSLSDDKLQYFISTRDFDLVRDSESSGQQPSYEQLSFIVDRNTRHLSGAGRDIELLEMVNNQCVRSLRKVTRQNIGKTWKQSFNLPFLNHLLPGNLKFTLTAIELNTKVYGQMVAVRALSEPFIVRAVKEKGGTGPVKAKISAVYLFNPEVEDVYLSVSVFEAQTDINGYKETLRHEVATYKTNPAGLSADLTGLGKEFEKLVQKLGLARKSLKVVKESPLPRWARSEGITTAQVANICAAAACEGASNPVVTVSIPAARTIALQSTGTLPRAGALLTVSGALAKNIPAVASMKIAAAPAFMGVGLGTAGAVAGGTVGTVAIAGGFDSDDDDDERSPDSP